MTQTLNHAITLAGGDGPFARELGVTRQIVGRWRKRGWVPPARALEIEQKYGVDRMSLVKPSLRQLLGSAS